jgi:hypothetical protein
MVIVSSSDHSSASSLATVDSRVRLSSLMGDCGKLPSSRLVSSTRVPEPELEMEAMTEAAGEEEWNGAEHRPSCVATPSL